jgi:nicotinate phosphoribosyltransferase
MTKATFPGKKNAYRLFDKDNCPLIDLLTKADEPEPSVGVPTLCRNPFLETKRAYLTPSRVEALLVPVWIDGQVVAENLSTLLEAKMRAKTQLSFLRSDHKRNMNPTPYKVRFLIFFNS